MICSTRISPSASRKMNAFGVDNGFHENLSWEIVDDAERLVLPFNRLFEESDCDRLGDDFATFELSCEHAPLFCMFGGGMQKVTSGQVADVVIITDQLGRSEHPTPPMSRLRTN